MKILFFGSSGPLSIIPLKFLLQSSHKLCAIGFETNSEVTLSELKYPVIASQNGTVEMLARIADVPAIKLFDNDDEYVEAIRACKPDIIIVSCLASKLPDSILRLPKLGCFNLHPSLLPAFRGPVPLFWQFREGVDGFGMTLHRMSARFDSGPVIAQCRLSMPDGIANQKATEILARAGSDLLDQTLDKIAKNEIVEIAQNEADSSYMSIPNGSDFEVSTTWKARRIYNFIRATEHWGKIYPCVIAGQKYQLVEALSYQSLVDSPEDHSTDKNIITISCADGLVTVKIAANPPF